MLRGDEKQTNKKSSCTNNENKAKVGMHRFHTATNRTVPDASAGSGLGGRKPRSRTARAWCVAESVPDKPEKTHKRRWGGRGTRSTRERFQDQGTASARWTQGRVGSRAGEERRQTSARSRQRRCAKTENLRSVLTPSFRLSYSLSVLNECFPPGDGTSQRGGRPSPSWDYKVLKHYQVF